MGAGRIPDRSDGVQMDDSWFNTVRSAMTGDIVAREAVLGVATDIAAKLGPSESYRFLKAFIAFGYWDCGDFKLHHSYNGLISAGEGWMLCDGRTVSQANYDTEHGSGHWATFVGSSPIDGLKLPDFTNRYAVGASSTTATGSGAIPTVGTRLTRSTCATGTNGITPSPLPRFLTAFTTLPEISLGSQTLLLWTTRLALKLAWPTFFTSLHQPSERSGVALNYSEHSA
jgi:hypothetical protein